jgi:uncharacterized protein YjiS (DUF1127 family)
MLSQICKRQTSGQGASAPLREDHIILLAIDALLAAYAAVRRWLQGRQTRRALADLDEHLLCDIGVSRAEAWRESRRWWPGRDLNRRALADLDDSQLSNLSDIGRHVRREARRASGMR